MSFRTRNDQSCRRGPDGVGGGQTTCPGRVASADQCHAPAGPACCVIATKLYPTEPSRVLPVTSSRQRNQRRFSRGSRPETGRFTRLLSSTANDGTPFVPEDTLRPSWP